MPGDILLPDGTKYVPVEKKRLGYKPRKLMQGASGGTWHKIKSIDVSPKVKLAIFECGEKVSTDEVFIMWRADLEFCKKCWEKK
jgi:hypothetical protein